MCYAHGSIDQAVHVCPMCRVFPHPRCPHQRDICRNRDLHPRIDVSYLKNAEVDSFNGCGYCKWARTNPPPRQAGYHNHGWPGCCRPPTINEYRLIQPADWRSVSIVHQVPVPPEIKAAFDSFGKRGSPTPAAARSSPSTCTRASAAPALDRKCTGSATHSKTSTLGRSSSASTKPRTSSPKQLYAPLNLNLSRTSSATAISSSVPTSSTLEQHRRHPSERRIDGVHSSQSSPKRRNIDLDPPITPRRTSTSRGPAVTPSTTSVSLSNVSADGRSPNQQPAQRRSTISNPHATPSKSSPPARPTDRTTSPLVVPRSTKKDDDMSSASSSSGSSDGLGSMSDSTVTSDGGFTDYLSDESEAELQRQAEARAALLAQNQAEELEFKAVRQQLAHIDLRPPKSWNSTNINTPRSPREAPITYPSRTAPLPATPAAATRV